MCAVLCVLLCGAVVGSEAGEAYRETLEVQKELVQTLREQLRGLGGEKQALRGRCEEQSHLLQDSQQRILALERELSSALRDNSPLAGDQSQSRQPTGDQSETRPHARDRSKSRTYTGQLIREQTIYR